MVVAAAGPSRARTVLDAAADANCDLIAAPYETAYGSLSPYLQGLFRGDVDVLVHRSFDGRTDWREVMVPVRGASDVAHSMIDFALRLAARTGRVSVCHWIRSGDRRRRDRSAASRLVSPPTFERIESLETDVAVIDRS